MYLVSRCLENGVVFVEQVVTRDVRVPMCDLNRWSRDSILILLLIHNATTIWDPPAHSVSTQTLPASTSGIPASTSGIPARGMPASRIFATPPKRTIENAHATRGFEW